MRRTLKYLKPYLLGVILCFAILAVQAMCELTLPDLMSDIVNVGIQQSGFEESLPEAISEDGMNLVSKFMSDSDEESFKSGYQFILPHSSEAVRYAEKYPVLEEKATYILKATDEENLKSMEGIYGNATYSLMLFLEGAAKEQGVAMDENTGVSEVDVTMLYQILPTLENVPKETLMGEGLSEEQSELMGRQVGITFTKLFYNEVGIDTTQIQRSYVFGIGFRMLGVALVAGLSAVLVGLLSSIIAGRVSRDMRHDLFSKVENFSPSEFDNFSTASLITRTTNDVQQVAMLVTFGLRMLAFPPIMGVGGVVFAFRKSPSMSWIIGLTVAILLLLLIVSLVIVLPKFTSLQKLTDKLNLVSRENLSGMLVIRAFGNEKHEEKRFEKANNDLSQTNLFVQRVMALLMPVMGLVMNLASLLIIWVGAHAIEQSTLQIGDMMAFIQYSMHIIMSFLMIAMMFVFLPRAAVSAKRIAEVLETPEEILDPESPLALEDVKGVVEFKNVNFKYSNAEENVLEDISFVAKPGETTAFIGSTGSGKSTLINLIPRFYDATSGSIMLDGKDVREVKQKELRENIGFVPQKGQLFSGTIETNMKYGKEDATAEEIEKAIETAQASEFVFAPDRAGLDGYVSQGGTNVSGGQRQRLSIARALVKQAPIYIFDDSFSALDFKTDAELRKALKGQTANSTVLIVAQRVSTIMNAEQIIVLDNGKIVGKGTHDELIENCPEYKEIAESQLHNLDEKEGA